MHHLAYLSLALLASLVILATGRPHPGYYPYGYDPHESNVDLSAEQHGYGYGGGYGDMVSDDGTFGELYGDTYSDYGYGRFDGTISGRAKKGQHSYLHGGAASYDGGYGAVEGIVGSTPDTSFGNSNGTSSAFGPHASGHGHANAHIQSPGGTVQTAGGSDSYRNAYGKGEASGGVSRRPDSQLTALGFSKASGGSGEHGHSDQYGSSHVKGTVAGETNTRSRAWTYDEADADSHGTGRGGIRDASTDRYTSSHSYGGTAESYGTTESTAKNGRKSKTQGHTKVHGYGGASTHHTGSSSETDDEETASGSAHAYSDQYGSAYAEGGSKSEENEYDPKSDKATTHQKAVTHGSGEVDSYGHGEVTDSGTSASSGVSAYTDGGSVHGSSTSHAKKNDKKYDW